MEDKLIRPELKEKVIKIIEEETLTTPGYPKDIVAKKMEEEFNLSEKIWELQTGGLILKKNDVKDFIRLREEENKDMEEDVKALISINIKNPPVGMMSKLARLFEIHKQERDKLTGEKLR